MSLRQPAPESLWLRVTTIDTKEATSKDVALERLRTMTVATKRINEMTDRLILAAVEDGASVRDVARALGISSPGTLSKRLARIRAGRPPGHR